MTNATFESPAACEVALWLIKYRPGLTEAELAEVMYGRRDQPRVHQDIDLLEGRGLIVRDRTTRPLRLYPG